MFTGLVSCSGVTGTRSPPGVPAPEWLGAAQNLFVIFLIAS
ncbi:hypothetical protein ACLBOM_38550 [Escherichia coli]